MKRLKSAPEVLADRLETVPMSVLEAQLNQIQKELDTRKRRASPIPQPLLTPDFTELIKVCASKIASIAKDGYCDEDLTAWIYEAAITAIYGPDVWKWINANSK